MRLRQLLCCPLLLAAWSCPPHLLADGDYAIRATDVLSDDCQFLPAGAAFEAGAETAGHRLRMGLTFGNQRLRLEGAFEENSEKFYADGSAANQSVTLNSQPCAVESVNLHLEGATDDARSFHGILRAAFKTEARPFCNCVVALTYRAEHR